MKSLAEYLPVDTAERKEEDTATIEQPSGRLKTVVHGAMGCGQKKL